jgi:hypothetical protein
MHFQPSNITGNAVLSIFVPLTFYSVDEFPEMGLLDQSI